MEIDDIVTQKPYKNEVTVRVALLLSLPPPFFLLLQLSYLTLLFILSHLPIVFIILDNNNLSEGVISIFKYFN